MEMINMSKKKLESLHPLILPKTVLNTECELFMLVYGGKLKILKRLYQSDGLKFANKLYTLESISSNAEYLPENFIKPEFLVAINKRIEAFVMNYVTGENLSLVLNDQSIDLEEKKYYLKRVGQILEQMSNIRKYTRLKDFYLGDLHEDNFIVDHTKREIYVADLDSCKISDNKAFPAKYLTSKALLNNVSGKYKIDNSEYNLTEYMVDENTDLYCYVIMILNYLYNGKINNVELTEFYNFLNYLDELKVNLELLECFNKIFSNSTNENPVNYIDTLTPKQISLARTYTRSKK